MAPNVTVGFWAANDINGTPLLVIDDEDTYFRGLKLKPDLYGLGGWELTLSRKVGFAILSSGAFQPETFVRFMVHAYSDTNWYSGGVLQKRSQTVVHREEDGEEVYVVGGPGEKQYLARYRLGIEEQGTGSGYVNLANGVWVWDEDATAGRILNRIVNDDADADDPALPDLTKSFTATNDSDAVAWADGIADADGSFQIPIGTSLLDLIWDLEDLGELYTTVNLGTLASPEYELNAVQSYGDDASGNDPGPGICILREGLNIANDSLVVKGVGIRKFSHVIVEGKDKSWATAVRSSWSPGDYVKWGKIEYTRSSNVNVLERAGLRFLRRQDNGDQEINVEIVPGAAPNDGYYFPQPGGVLWPGNTITLDTSVGSSTPLDYQNEEQLVTGVELKLGPAGDTATADKKAKSWDVTVLLNHERAGNPQHPDQTSAARVGVPHTGLQLCEALVPGTESFNRLYLTDTGATTRTPSALWNDTGDLFTFAMTLTPTATTSGAGSDWAHVNQAPASFGLLQGTITLSNAALLAAVQAGGTFRLQNRISIRHGIGIDESAHREYLDATIRVYRPGTSSYIGTLFAVGDYTSTVQALTDLAGTPQNRGMSGVTAAVPGAVATDQLVVEWGIKHTAPTSGGAGGAVGWNDAAASDLPEDDTTLDDLNSWVELRSATATTGSGLHPDIVGTSHLAARCDGTEHVQRAINPTVNDDEGSGYPVNTHWLNTESGAVFWLVDNTDGAAEWILVNPEADSGIDSLSELSDVTIDDPGLDDDLRFNGTTWFNDPRKWEAVTNGEDVFVWDGDDLVHEWNQFGSSGIDFLRTASGDDLETATGDRLYAGGL